jgi:hypothetical protein
MALVIEAGAWEPLRWRGAGPLEQARRILSRVALCLPTYREPTSATAAQVATLELLGALPLRLSDCGNVAMARNAITARWMGLGDPRPWLLCIDGDVSAPEGAAAWLEFVARAIERWPDGEAAVCGCYPWRRRGGGRFAVSFVEPEGVTLGQGGGYHRAKWAGGGALLIHRSAVDRLGEIAGGMRLRYRFGGRADVGPQVWHNTSIETPDGVVEEAGEDVGLTQDLVTMGIDLWCDTRLRLDHEGACRFTWEDALRPEPPRSASIPLVTGGPS